MKTKSSVLVIFLVLVFWFNLLACAKTRGTKEDEETMWAELTSARSGSMTSNSIEQYYLELVTDPPGIASPTGGGWYDAGSNVTVSTQEFIDIDMGRSRYKFVNWTTSGMSEIKDHSLLTTFVLIDKDKTVTANYVLQYRVIFDQSGTYKTPHEDTIVQVDGVNYYNDTMPASFWYDNGSEHTFYYNSLIIITAKKRAYAWANTTGLSTARYGSIIVYSSGNITGNYKMQYYLDVASQYGAPSPGYGWFDSGSEVFASVSSPVIGESGTRYVCTGWTGTGSAPASGSGTMTTFTITEGSRIVWNWKTQFLLTVTTDPLGLGSQPSKTPAGETVSADSWWYETATNVTLTAGIVADFTFDVWSVDGVPEVHGVNPVLVVMNAAHNATAYYYTRHVGDINADGKVDMKDVGYVARRFMCVLGDPLWDVNADFNSDERIDMVDIGTVAQHFGESRT